MWVIPSFFIGVLMRFRLSSLIKSVSSMVLVVALLVALSQSSYAQIRNFEKAMAAKTKSKKDLFKVKGVVGAGIGADANKNAIIRVYTDKAGVVVPGKIDGIPVVVRVVGNITAWTTKQERARQEQEKKKDGGKVESRAKGGKGKPGNGGLGSRDRHPRPVPIGVSVGTDTTSFCFAGTLGCRLKLVNITNGNIVARYMLSNNHVFAEENALVPGTNRIIQPGTLDNNCVFDSNDVIGTLYDFVPLNFTGGATNLVDAAIATANTNDVGTATPSAGWGNPTSNSVSAFVGQVVQKYGRTTAYTEGVVDAIGVSVNVAYDSGTASFDNQIVIIGRARRGKRYVASTFSDSGDSGSLIVDSNRNPVGLLFAGNTSVTIANPIDAVLDEFSDFSSGLLMFVDDGN